jgi:hypothetical protein
MFIVSEISIRPDDLVTLRAAPRSQMDCQFRGSPTDAEPPPDGYFRECLIYQQVGASVEG